MLRSVNSLLNEKGSDVWSVRPGDFVFDALEIMADKDVGALVVQDGEKIVGVFSERDYARHGRCSAETCVSEFMSKEVTWVKPTHNVGECMALMTNQHVRHLPVVDQGKLVGLISIGDVVKAALSAQGLLIDQLEKYIIGSAA